MTPWSGRLRLEDQLRHPRAGSAGQTLPVVVIFMFSLIGCAAMAVDVGAWYLEKRQLQAEVDAAALAGASQLPQGWSAAQTTAGSNFAKNQAVGDSVSISNTTSSGGTASDSVRVVASRPAKIYFAKLFGIGSGTVTASATATIQTVNAATDADGPKPWGVMQNSFSYGQTVSLFGGLDQTGNFGAIDLPLNGPPSMWHQLRRV